MAWWAHRLPPALEDRYVHETDLPRNRQIRHWVVVGLAFSWLNFATDLVVIPEIWWLSFLLHLGVVTPVSLIAIRLLPAARTRWRAAFASIAPPCCSILTVLVCFAFAKQPDTFRASVVLASGIFAMNVLIPMRLCHALAFVLITAALGNAINLIPVVMHRAVIAYPDIVVTAHVLVGLSLLSRLLAERDSRRSFVAGLQTQLRAEELARSNAALLDMSRTDPLTGLANRRHFDLAFQQAWSAAALARTPVAVMMIDVDHFKSFNDAAGHLEGDRCLISVARAISDHIRHGHDLPARFGGEEFVVLMPATEAQTAHEIAERIRTAVAALRVFHPGQLGRGFVSVSIGVAARHAAAPGETPARLLAAADAAMYAAKGTGRDRVVSAEADRHGAIANATR